jgi:hypothetical protein
MTWGQLQPGQNCSQALLHRAAQTEKTTVMKNSKTLTVSRRKAGVSRLEDVAANISRIAARLRNEINGYDEKSVGRKGRRQAGDYRERS